MYNSQPTYTRRGAVFPSAVFPSNESPMPMIRTDFPWVQLKNLPTFDLIYSCCLAFYHVSRKGFTGLFSRLATTRESKARTIYDPCCGSGGMLTIAKDRILESNPYANVYLFGQEVNPETFAICKSDLYMKSSDGKDAENIKFGSTLSKDQLASRRFDYIIFSVIKAC